MPILFQPVFNFITNLFAKFFTDNGLKFVAHKSLLVTLLTVTFPATLKAFLTWLFEGLMGIAGAVPHMDDMASSTAQLVGQGAYIASHLQLPEAIAILLTACAIRLALNFIPFIG